MTDVIVEMLCLVLDIAVYVCILVVIGHKPYETRVFERDEMTRKDYEKLAKMVRVHRQNDDGLNSATIASIADSLACICEEDNPRFDRAKFFIYCGMDEDGTEWVI